MEEKAEVWVKGLQWSWLAHTLTPLLPSPPAPALYWGTPKPGKGFLPPHGSILGEW